MTDKPQLLMAVRTHSFGELRQVSHHRMIVDMRIGDFVRGDDLEIKLKTKSKHRHT